MKNLTVSDYRTIHRERQDYKITLSDIISRSVNIIDKQVEEDNFYNRFKTITDNQTIKF